MVGSRQVAGNKVIHGTLRFVTEQANALPLVTLCDLIHRCFYKSRYYEKSLKDDIPFELKKVYLKPPEDGDKSHAIWARMPVCLFEQPSKLGTEEPVARCIELADSKHQLLWIH